MSQPEQENRQSDRHAGVIAALIPSLRQLEQEHLQRRQALIRQLAMILLSGALFGLVLVLIFGWAWRGLFVMAVILALVAGLFWLQRAQESWSERVIAELLPSICNAWGEVCYVPEAPRQDFVDPFETLHAVGKHNRRCLSHHFSGRIGQRHFEMLHVDLSQSSGGSNSSRTPVFYGLLICFQLTRPAPVPILILPKASLTGRIKSMVLVEPELAAFAEKFTIQVPHDLPTAPVQAQSFLDASWQQALLAINQTEGRGNDGLAAVRLGMIKDSGYLALSRWVPGAGIGSFRLESPQPFLQVPFLLRQSIRLEDSVRTMLDDVGVAFRIIGQLPES